MLRSLFLIAALASLTASAAAQLAQPPTLLTRAVAATQAARSAYAFDFEINTRSANWRARFEPNATPRLRLIAPARDSLAPDQRRAFDRLAEQFEGVSWCASENMARVTDMRLLREDDTTATYAFRPTRESIRGEQARRFVDRINGEVTLLKAEADVARVRLFTPAAFSPLPLVNVERFNLVITCAPAPNGRNHATETVTEVRGSAFGQDFDERSVQRASNLGPP